MSEPLTAEEAVEKALLFTFQLSSKDYRKMKTALSEAFFIRALEQDGYTVAALDAARTPALDVERLARALDKVMTADGCHPPCLSFIQATWEPKRLVDEIAREYAALATPPEPGS